MAQVERVVSIMLVSFALLSPVLSSGEAKAYSTDSHPILVDYALEVLWTDGWEYLVDYLVESEYIGRVRSAVVDCDRLDLALNHYYDPVLEAGLAGATPATEVAQEFFSKAVEIYANGDPGTAWYYFGWGLHCVQDLMVPFHSNLDPLNGHSEYEAYAHEYRHYLPLPSAGVYDLASNATQWAVNASLRSYPYYDAVSGDNATDANFDTVLTLLFPQTVALTAGYIKFFADVVGVGEFNLYSLERGIDWVKVGWDEYPGAEFQAYEVWFAIDEDDIYDGDPYATITDRTQTVKTVSGLELGVDYHVQVRLLAANTSAESNLIEISPAWPIEFLAVPFATAAGCILLLLTKKHRRPSRARR